MELVDGKDAPHQVFKKYSELDKSVDLLWCPTASIWGLSKCVVLDLGSCILKGVIKLRKKGMFAISST